MSDPSPPSPTSATLSEGSTRAQQEPFEPTYALLDPEALDLNDFDDGFETGVDDFNADPLPWEEDLLSVEALEDLFQPPPDALGPPPEFSSIFEPEAPTSAGSADEPSSGGTLGRGATSPSGYAVDVPLSKRRNTLSPRSLSEHPIFNSHDTPTHDDGEPFEARPVDFFTSRKPPERGSPWPSSKRGASPAEEAHDPEDQAEAHSPEPPRSREEAARPTLNSSTPLEVIEQELTRSLSDLKREAQERAARRAARRARREAQAQGQEALSPDELPLITSMDDPSERHTLDESISSKDSDLPVEADLERGSEPPLSSSLLRAQASPQRAGAQDVKGPKPIPHERHKARAKSVAFMGSQGGVGLSLIVANLGVAIAKLGFKVVLADFNPSGLNLHTYLGLEPIISTPSDLLRLSPDPHVEQVPLQEAGSPERHLWLCRPAPSLLSVTPVEHRMRAFQALKKIDADFILMDLGHDADQFSLERYREATKSVTVFRPSPVSIERGHNLIRAALFSALIAQGDDASIVARALLMADHVGQLNAPSALLKALERVNPQAAILMRKRLVSFEPLILLNQCKTHADRDLTLDLCAILQRKWRISASPLGAIDHDESAQQDSRQRVSAPLIVSHSGCSVSSDLERFARRFARELLKVEQA